MLAEILTIIFAVFFVLLLGYAAGLANQFDRHQVAGINELVLKFALPASLFVGTVGKAAEVLLKILESEQPPSHLLLGSDALKLVREKVENLRTDFTLWEKVTCSTDFD